ncbi:tRNA (cytosine(72)-C(5))-methyltransferase NSUN6 isoform X3 [Entelurus aequoreus]|uniref:tRNA (cytosine(72)-C(5))-methyltransferase NSUN6 isoform X3 n=1 Tax=Entelurus aequoreus TaxID=161455 RepID=UPI002B1CE40C|nr:tRNA (cytosine(72)-C(5))-methyltransferase NSUN6 isoform X3 [Entelurus aequoreus]
MAFFPSISLRAGVIDYLKGVYLNNELLASAGPQKAQRHFETLLSCLSHPPSYTCVRASVHLAPLGEIQHKLYEELTKRGEGLEAVPHPGIPDVLLLPVDGPRCVQQLSKEVVVGAQCGNAVLRGAHVFTPGMLACPKHMKAGDAVSVFSDLEGKCTRGALSFQGRKVFVGNGVAEKDRASIFGSGDPARGVGVRMTEPLYATPSFDGLLPQLVFLQGEVVALERIPNKMELIRQNAEMLQLRCIKAFCFNSTRAASQHSAKDAEASSSPEPPFHPESFDRVLLDAPCSGLGQRPNMASTWSLKEICSFPPLQRKLFHAAVQLLKRGGVLVYSTCTVTLAENEEQVAWALRTFPCLRLQPQEPHVGAEGMAGAGLAPEQLRLLQRFRPELNWQQADDGAPLTCRANSDTIGFFIAKFQKSDSSEDVTCKDD